MLHCYSVTSHKRLPSICFPPLHRHLVPLLSVICLILVVPESCKNFQLPVSLWASFLSGSRQPGSFSFPVALSGRGLNTENGLCSFFAPEGCLFSTKPIRAQIWSRVLFFTSLCWFLKAFTYISNLQNTFFCVVKNSKFSKYFC